VLLKLWLYQPSFVGILKIIRYFKGLIHILQVDNFIKMRLQNRYSGTSGMTLIYLLNGVISNHLTQVTLAEIAY